MSLEHPVSFQNLPPCSIGRNDSRPLFLPAFEEGVEELKASSPPPLSCPIW